MNAKIINSPPGIGLTKFRLFKKFHAVSKNLGIINKAISDLLDSSSQAIANPAKNAPIAAFYPNYLGGLELGLGLKNTIHFSS